MIIRGANLEPTETEFTNLSGWDWTNDEEKTRLIKYIEDTYYSLESQVGEVKEFPHDGNDHVLIVPGMLNHRCSPEFENLESMSAHGVLASEWFGVLESEFEGRFCVFISRMKDDNYPYKGDLAEDNRSRLNMGRNVLLFFDDQNPVMKKLLHLDYFEYENIKKTDPSKLSEIYTSDEIELFDKLIEPLSPAGAMMRSDYDSKFNYWSAIVGGIPSSLVNGVCIKNNNFSEEENEKISDLFPNATVFNSDLEIVCERKKSNDKSHKI